MKLLKKGAKFNVLDKGYIRLVDYMGSDDRIVEAARTSYGKGTKTVHENEGLIRYLMRHRHTTPFEMCELVLQVYVPMDCWRQWIRHRMASVNEYSTRYSIAIDDKQKTSPEQWRLQSKKNKQGSGGYLTEWPEGKHEGIEPGQYLSARENKFHQIAEEIYNERLDFGIANEQARKDLPLSNYTLAYWKIDLHNLLHFLSLRMDSHAQYEIRQYANVIGNNIVAELFPLTWKAFQDYRLNAMQLSARDIEMIKYITSNIFTTGYQDGIDSQDLKEIADVVINENWFGWFNVKDDGTLKNNRERSEFEVKAERLGIEVPWKD